MNLCQAQLLAYAFPCRRFAAALAGVRARLRVDADRYSLIVSDFHRLLLAGLPGALRNIPYVISRAIAPELTNGIRSDYAATLPSAVFQPFEGASSSKLSCE